MTLPSPTNASGSPTFQMDRHPLFHSPGKATRISQCSVTTRGRCYLPQVFYCARSSQATTRNGKVVRVQMFVDDIHIG
jgi:hypothetical protein